MSNDNILTILLSHGVRVNASEGLILAYDEYWDTVNKCSCGEWVNVTGYSLKQLRDFLNY